MAVVRGFVQKIDVGRAGLVQVTLIHEDATTGAYVIRDLDADPERFNERLSKLGILRDAMNRAEPVEIEFRGGEGGNEIDRAARVTRDDLIPPKGSAVIKGLVLQVMITAVQGIQAGGTERADEAAVVLLDGNGAIRSAVLNLQTPERVVAAEMLRVLLDAEAKTGSVTVILDQGAGSASRILSVIAGGTGAGTGEGNTSTELSGFAETLSLIPLAAAPVVATMAHVRFTTAPPFTGAGNTISKSPFTPTTVDLLVPKNSLAYALFEAGLRDNLRMRVQAQPLGRTPDQPPNRPPDTPPNPPGNDNPVLVLRAMGLNLAAATTPGTQLPNVLLVTAAELLAPLASASRPVWINIDRESLDRGPECGCAEGVPSSDLSAKTLRDLRIPYTAVWKGLGCFNRGVYRIQIESAVKVELKLDCEKLCVHDSDNPKVKFAYACLCGDHELEVTLEDWTCDMEFNLDVYRIR